MKKPLMIGIAGGSGSGKTTVVKKIASLCSPATTLMFQLDSYYRDLSHLTPAERDQVNFDHPQALEIELLERDLRQLALGKAISGPEYDFSSHTRRRETTKISPTDVIFIDGIFTLYFPVIRDLLDFGIFIDVADDIRFIRRLRRDVSERGRSNDSVIQQYLSTVKPMHELFVEPTKHFADFILPWNEYRERSLNLISQVIHMRA